jgi:molecular chaperone GrpE (heat shock protein)
MESPKANLVAQRNVANAQLQHLREEVRRAQARAEQAEHRAEKAEAAVKAAEREWAELVDVMENFLRAREDKGTREWYRHYRLARALLYSTMRRDPD